jgi:hypothetical protein
MHQTRHGLTSIEIIVGGCVLMIMVIAIPLLFGNHLKSTSDQVHSSVRELLEERTKQQEIRDAARAKHPLGSERRLGDSDRRVMIVRYDTDGIVVLLDNGASVTVDATVLKPLPTQPEATAPTP